MIVVPRLPRLDPWLARNLWLDVAATMLGSLYLTVPNSFAGVVARNLGAPPIYLGMYWAMTYYGAALSLFGGRWLPQRRLIAYVVAIGIVGRAATAPASFIADPLVFIVVMGLIWGTVDVTNPITADVTRRIFPVELRGQLVGLVRTAAVLTVLVGAPLFGWVLDLHGPRVLFPLAAIVGIVGWVVYSQIRPPPAPVETLSRYSPADLVRDVRGDPNLTRWLVVQQVWGLGTTLFHPLLPVLLVDRFHATYTQVGLISTFASVAAILSYLVSGRLFDRLPAHAIYPFALGATAIGPLGYLLSPSVEGLWVVALCQGLVGAATDVGAVAIFTRMAPEGMYLRYVVAVSSIGAIRGAILALGGPLLYSAPWFGPEPLLLLAASCQLASGALARTMLASSPLTSPSRPA